MPRNKDNLTNRAKNWTDDESRTLFNIYGAYRLQRKFEGLDNHSKVYMSISKDLEDMGFTGRHWLECKNKITNVKALYSKEMKKVKSGISPSDWPLFNDIHEIMSRRYQFNEEGHPQDSLEEDNSLVHVGLGLQLEGETEIVLLNENHHCENSLSMKSFATVSSGRGGDASLPDDRPTLEPINSKPKTEAAFKVKRTRRSSSDEAEPTAAQLHRKMIELMEKRHRLDEAAHARENALAASMKTFFDVQTELMRAQLRRLNAPPATYLVTPQPSNPLTTQASACDVCTCGRADAGSPTQPTRPGVRRTSSQHVNSSGATVLSSVTSSGPPLAESKEKTIDFSKIRILKVKMPFVSDN